jgi:hypothetical protein
LEHVESAPRSQSAVTALIVGVVVAALAVFAVFATHAAHAVVHRPGAFFGFLAVTVVLQLKVIEVPEEGAVSFASIGMLCAAFELGAGPAMLVAGAAAAVRWVTSRGRLDRALFDIATLALASAAAAGTHAGIGRLDHQPNDHLGPSLFAAALFFVVNVGLVSVAMGLSEGERPFQIWKRRFRWMTPWALLSGPFAAVLLVVYEQVGWVGIVAAAVAPLALTTPARKSPPAG